MELKRRGRDAYSLWSARIVAVRNGALVGQCVSCTLSLEQGAQGGETDTVPRSIFRAPVPSTVQDMLAGSMRCQASRQHQVL